MREYVDKYFVRRKLLGKMLYLWNINIPDQMWTENYTQAKIYTHAELITFITQLKKDYSGITTTQFWRSSDRMSEFMKSKRE